MWILIRWLHQKPGDLDLHCFTTIVQNFENIQMDSLLDKKSVDPDQLPSSEAM